MTEKILAELLEHYVTRTGRCSCGAQLLDARPQVITQHVAEALASAGIGPIRQAQAQALREAADELARLPYAKPDAPDREEYERLLAIRRGNTDSWLRQRALDIEREASPAPACPHQCEAWQIRDCGNGMYCGACGCKTEGTKHAR